MFRPQRKLFICLLIAFSVLAAANKFVSAQGQTTDLPIEELIQGVKLLNNGDNKGAAVEFKKAVKKQPHNADGWFLLGSAYLRDSQLKDAQKAFEKALDLQPDHSRTHAGLSYLLLLQNDLAKAVEEARKALAVDSQNTDALYVMGASMLRSEDPASALKYANQVLKINPDFVPALTLKAYSLAHIFTAKMGANFQRSQWKESKEKETVEEIQKRTARANQEVLDQAIECLERVIKLSPNSADAHRTNLETLKYYAQYEKQRVESFDSSDKSVPTTRPVITYKERVAYTDAARRAGIRGKIVLSAMFTAEGEVKHILVLEGLSHGLTEQAIKAAQAMRFKPATKNGQPVSIRMTLEFYLGG